MSETTIYHESSEPVKYLRDQYNSLLIDKFGIDTVSGLPIWRISWAQDQYVKQLGIFEDYTEGGIYLRTVKEVREIPKYPHLPGLYILEMLQAIPEVNLNDMPTGKISYECMHPYQHKLTNKYLPPNWVFTEWVIDCYYAALGKHSLHKYIDPAAEMGAKEKRCNELFQYLYGNDTAVSDALTYGHGVFLDSTKQLKDNKSN